MAQNKPSSPEFRPEYRESVEGVRKALSDLKKTIEQGKDDTKEATPSSIIDALNGFAVALNSVRDRPGLQAFLAEEIAAINTPDGTKVMEELIKALTEGGDERKLRSDLASLDGEITGIRDYLKKFPQPSFQDRIWEFVQKLDPNIRNFLLPLVESHALGGFFTGPIRWRMSLEEAMESEDVRNNPEYLAKLNDPQRFDKIQKEFSNRYSKWQKANVVGQQANRPLSTPVPTVIDVIMDKPFTLEAQQAVDIAQQQTLFGVADMQQNKNRAIGGTESVDVKAQNDRRVVTLKGRLLDGGKQEFLITLDGTTQYLLKNQQGDPVQKIELLLPEGKSAQLAELKIFADGKDVATFEQAVTGIKNASSDDTGTIGVLRFTKVS